MHTKHNWHVLNVSAVQGCCVYVLLQVTGYLYFVLQVAGYLYLYASGHSPRISLTGRFQGLMLELRTLRVNRALAVQCCEPLILVVEAGNAISSPVGCCIMQC